MIADARTADQRRRESEAARSRERYYRESNVGDIPPVVNPRHREACRRDLLLFLQWYFPESTGASPFSIDHLRVIHRIESAILHGGRTLNAVYRGFAKTSITEGAAIWAILYGHRRSILIVAASQKKAKESNDSIQSELEHNDRLSADFPEVCVPVQHLEGKNQRAASQHINGDPTNIKWTTEETIFPTVAGSVASNAAIFVRGITGEIRGAKHKTITGVVQRPDFAFIDDLQTDKTAATDGQCDKLLSLVHKAVLKCAGHRKTIAAVMNATVIRKRDAVDQMLTEPQYRIWQTERIPMVRKWADAHESFWLGPYKETRENYDPDILDDQLRAHAEANELYRQNREAADAGCEVSWKSCYDPELEQSAIQHAYNQLIDDGEDVFASECQQEPLDRTEELTSFDFDHIIGRAIAIERGVVPAPAELLTAFIDVSESVLWYMVCAWWQGFSGHVVTYGAWPDNGPYLTKDSAKVTLLHKLEGSGQDAAWLHGLNQLGAQILGREYRSETGGLYRGKRCLIDINDSDFTDTGNAYIRRSPFSPILMGSRGIGITASRKPLNDVGTKPKPGEVRGKQWRTYRHPHVACSFDTNYWKSFVERRLVTNIGDPGAITIYQGDAAHHKMLAEQLTAEYSIPTFGRERQVNEWKLRAHATDEHFWDCLVGCAVAASIEGVSLEGEPAAVKRSGKKVKYSDVYRKKLEQLKAGQR